MLMASSYTFIDYLNPENGELLGSVNVDYVYKIASDEINVKRWLKSSVSSGIIPKDGGTASIGVTFNSTGLYAGVYNGMVIIEHEKGWAPGPFVVNCKLKVKSEKLIEVVPANLNFGAVAVGDTAILLVELMNNGNDTTTIKKVQSSSKEFKINITAPFKIAPFSSTVVDATYIPVNIGWDVANYTLKTDAANITTVIINARGQGVTSVPSEPDTLSSPNLTSILK
jgi:hypothetical protein